jgi:hypothetical protein
LPQVGPDFPTEETMLRENKDDAWTENTSGEQRQAGTGYGLK